MNVQVEPEVQPAPGVTPPEIPYAVAKVPPFQTIKGRMLKRVLSREEKDLYVETWNDWLIAHPEYDNVEDLDDVSQVCMETVFMFRLKLVQMQKPTIDISEPYNQSYRRKQEARSNLMARRKDREAAKHGVPAGPTLNIAVIASGITPEMMQKRLHKLAQEDERELHFLENTIKVVASKAKEDQKDET